MNGSGIEITKDLTIPKLFLKQCRKYGKNKVAMREKEFGIWIPFTWQDYYDNGLISQSYISAPQS